MLLSPTIFHLFLSPFFYLCFLLSLFPLSVSMLSFLNTLQTTNVVLPRIMLPASDILNKNGISRKRKKKSAWRGRAAILWALCTSRCFFHLVVSRTPWGQWQERDFWCKLLDLLNICHFRARLSHTWMMNEFIICNYIRKKFCHVLFSEAEVEWKF